MEKRLCRKVDEHFVGIKDNIREWLENNGVKCMQGEEDITSEFLKFVSAKHKIFIIFVELCI